jgi:H+-transporting ATPase
VAATLQLLFFFFIAVFALPPRSYDIMNHDFMCREHDTATPKPQVGEQFFHIPVLMFMLITLLNDGTLMSIGYDRVFPSPQPQKWNLRGLFFVAAVLAGVACISSLILLWAALDSWNESGVFYKLGLPPLCYGKVVSMLYLKISISDFLTLFSARTQDRWFFAYRPSHILLIGAILSLATSTIVACFFPDGHPDNIPVRGLARGEQARDRLLPLWVWIYCIFWWFIQDIAKVWTYKFMNHVDLFQFRSQNQPGGTLPPSRKKKDETREGDIQEPLIHDKKPEGYGTSH